MNGPSAKKIFLLAAAALAALALAAAASLSLLAVHRGMPSETGGAADAGSGTSWNPEIVTSEYWDYGTLNGLKLFVNNTDKSVIYALDPDTGKTVWKIEGKDYGISGYEIRNLAGHLFLTRGYSQGGGDITPLWVFDGNGRMAWNHSFYGYVDMPQLLLIDGGKTAVIESRTGFESCRKTCGVLCSGRTPPDQCTTGETWAFSVDTGKVKWVNRTPTYAGHYLKLAEDGDIEAYGNAGNDPRDKYVLSSENGEVIEHELSLGDSAGRAVLNDRTKTLSYIRPTDDLVWTAKPGDKIYDFVNQHADSNDIDMYSAGYDTLLFVQWSVSGYRFIAADSLSGRILWNSDALSDHRLISLHRAGDALILAMNHVSSCKQACDACPAGAALCADYGKSAACSRCEAQEKSSAGYARQRIVSIIRDTGKIKWRWQHGDDYLEIYDLVGGTARVSVSSPDGKTVEYRVLDLNSGLDRKALPSEEPPKWEEAM